MKRSLVPFLALGLVATLVSAQQPAGTGVPGGPRGGGRGGFGGFGGPTQLLQNEKVQTELKIKTGQKRRITELSDELKTEMQGAFNFQALQGVSDEQRQQMMDEFRQKGQEMQAKAKARLAEILDAEQMDRLNQLQIQQSGIRAIGQADVQESLGLSPAQKAKVTKITTEAMQSFTQGFGGAGGQRGPQDFQKMSEEERKKFMEDMRKRGEDMRKRGDDMTKELEGVLTDSQKTKFEEMKGEKFEFPAFGGFGGRGPGGPGGPNPSGEAGDTPKSEATGEASEEKPASESSAPKSSKKTGKKAAPRASKKTS